MSLQRQATSIDPETEKLHLLFWQSLLFGNLLTQKHTGRWRNHLRFPPLHPWSERVLQRRIDCKTVCLIPFPLTELKRSKLYTLESRIQFAGWTQDNIKAYKGPTTEIVSGLATNVRSKLGSTYTISESGTAGPTGGNTPNRTP